MSELLSLLSIGLAFFIVAVSPGPATLSNATLAMSRGRKTSLIYSAGLSSGLVFWGVIAASGMGAILQSSIYLLMTLKIFGGLYLLRLAYLSAKTAMNPEENKLAMSDKSISGKSLFMRGLLLNMSNPKTVVAWVAALSVGMDSDGSILFLIAALLVCIAVGFFVNAMYSICFSFNGVMNWYQKARRWIDGVSSALFSLAGFTLIRSAFQRNPMP